MLSLNPTGGAETTEGSLRAAKNVNLKLSRQDDVSQMQANLIKFAEAYKNNPGSASGGAHFVSIMGDGAAAFLAGVNPQLEKIGKEYRAQVIYTCGRSLGEDKFMDPPAWKLNPQTARVAYAPPYCAILIDRGICWHDNIQSRPEFHELVDEVRALFPTL